MTALRPALKEVLRYPFLSLSLQHPLSLLLFSLLLRFFW